MSVDCPKCGHSCDVTEALPDRACDDEEYTCPKCEHTFVIGWTAEAEIRDPKI